MPGGEVEGASVLLATRGTRYLSALVGVHHIGRVRGRTACSPRHIKRQKIAMRTTAEAVIGKACKQKASK